MTNKTQAPAEIKVSWLAIIYSPQLEPVYHSAASSLLAAPVPQRQKCHPINIGLPFEKETLPGERVLGGSISRSIFLQPGASLGINARDWEAAQTTAGFDRFVAPKLKAGIIQVFQPSDDDGLEPGYRYFDEEAAIKLIQATLHEDWLDSWLVAEERKAVKVAAATQRAELVRIKETLQAS